MNICDAVLSAKAMKKGFVLTYDCLRRYEGEWHPERKILFPAQIFLESENGSALSEEVRRCPDLRRNELFSVSMDEEMLLKKLCGERGNLGMSKGILRKGVPKIILGPLKGMENHIRKIDRHKSLARVGTLADFVRRDETRDDMRNPSKSLSDLEDLSAYPMEEWGLRYIMAGLEITDKII